MSSIDLPKETHLDYAGTPDTNNATFIYWQDIKPYEEWTADYYPLNKRRYWHEQDKCNGGEVNGNWHNRQYHRRRENWWIIETMADQLELTPRQRRRALGWFMNLKLEDWGPPKEVVAYCLCAYLVHSDPRDVRSCHPRTPDDKKDQLFLFMEEVLDLREEPKLGKSTLDSTYGKVQYHVGAGPTPYVEPFDKYGKFEGVSGPFIPDSKVGEAWEWG